MSHKEGQALQIIREQLATARNPIVLCSFGKDSLVLLHMCLRLRKVPVLFFRFAKFHEKHAHAHTVMQAWDLEVYDLWPRVAIDYQHKDFFEVFHGYTTGEGGTLFLATGLQPRLPHETRYLCAVEDLLLRPKAQQHDYPWDATFHGHKGSDHPEFGAVGPIVQPISQLGTTRLVVPFTDWTDDDIWAYIHKYDLPYDHQRYDQHDSTVSPDAYPTCFSCIDTRLAGETVVCPKYQKSLINIARPASTHDTFRRTVIESVQYCEISGAPRSSEHTTHL